MSQQRRQQKEKKPSAKTGSTTSLGKRRSLRDKDKANRDRPSRSPPVAADKQQSGMSSSHSDESHSSMSPGKNEYGSQATSFRSPTLERKLTKVAILGAAGGIGQPLALLLMLHSEYIQHVALYDLVPSVHGVGLELSHIDRQCKVTSHLGPSELPEALKDAKVIVCPAGLAQKPGMSRDDLFGSNAKIMYNLAKACAQHAPNAMLAIISNPVNSLVPLACEVYQRVLGSSSSLSSSQSHQQHNQHSHHREQQQQQQEQQQQHPTSDQQHEPAGTQTGAATGKHGLFGDWCRRIFGVTTLDVVRASTLTARSGLFKPDPSSGLFKDPAKIQVPVVGGHAGKTILPLLSRASPRLDKKRLLEDKITTHSLVESIQQAGIEVLGAKKGTGTATLSMAYAACRFTISLLRAQQGEQNIVECAYVKHSKPVVADLEYFSLPLLLGKDGYVKSMGLSSGSSTGASSPATSAQQQPVGGVHLAKLLPFELEMIEEACRELRTSIAKGEDFARNQLSSEKA